MKFIKLYESFDDDIDSICEKYGIENYTINSDGLVDVDGDIDLSSKDLTKLPLKFGKVGGNFTCRKNQLITLEGCPQSIGGNFHCNINKLITLEGCPQSIGGHFNCFSNLLTTLECMPKSVRGHFYLMNNQLKDLYGFPEFFDRHVYYHSNPVQEILDLFKTKRLGKVINFLNEYGVIQQDGKVVILDRLEEVFHTLNIKMPKKIKLRKYEVY